LLNETPLGQIKDYKMFKLFKPYMLPLLILLASSSIAMAQDCGGCPIGRICENGDCIIDVDLDRDRDGVPDAVDNCPDVANAPQVDRDMDDIGDACDDDIQAAEEERRNKTIKTVCVGVPIIALLYLISASGSSK
jgi:hypothetical protein